MSSQLPVWLLDVDGVLNATRPGWGGPPVTRSITAQGTSWRMRFSPQVIAGIRAIATTSRAEIRWATTWVGHIDDLSRVFALPTFPAAFDITSEEPTQAVVAPLKLAAALAVVRSGRPLIWTDDDAIPVDGPDRAALDGAGALLIAPKPGRGLRPDDLDRINAYLDNGSVEPSRSA
jgi:hypothetical protein